MRLALIKMQAFRSAILLKRDFNACVFLRILQKLLITAFYTTLSVAAFHIPYGYKQIQLITLVKYLSANLHINLQGRHWRYCLYIYREVSFSSIFTEKELHAVLSYEFWEIGNGDWFPLHSFSWIVKPTMLPYLY